MQPERSLWYNVWREGETRTKPRKTQNKDKERTTPMDTFKKTIWVSKKSAFEDKVKRLNRLLKKQGKEPITFSYENYRSVPVVFEFHQKGDAFKNDKFETYSVEICDVVCSGVLEVKKDDVPYTYIGSVSIDAGIRQVFCKDENYANYFMDGFKEGWCDHCKSRRMNRKSYHLFATDKGEVVQIGSTCAKEYFGIDSVAFLETYRKTFFVDYSGDEGDVANFGGGSRTMSYGQIVPFLDYATNGFLKWNKKGEWYDNTAPLWEQPTVSAVRALIDAEENGMEIKDKCYKLNALNLNLSLEDCIAFWQAKADREKNGGSPFATVSTFTFNALETLRAGYATSKSLGSFCYAVFAAYNAKVRQIQEEAAASQEHVPCRWAKGTRTDIRGTIVNIREIETLNKYRANWSNGYYGEEETRYVVDFKDEAGTLYHFTTSGASFAEVENGMEVSIRGKVEDTKPFKGVPYTRLSRPVCTILDKKVA